MGVTVLQEERRFRQDLYFRVNVLRIEVPSLQERLEDIPILANHFVTTYAIAYHKPVRSIDQEAMELLVQYHWPGNIRELENLIQRLVVLSEGETIQARDLPENMQRRGPILLAEEIVESESQSFEERLREFHTPILRLRVPRAGQRLLQ